MAPCDLGCIGSQRKAGGGVGRRYLARLAYASLNRSSSLQLCHARLCMHCILTEEARALRRVTKRRASAALEVRAGDERVTNRLHSCGASFTSERATPAHPLIVRLSTASSRIVELRGPQRARRPRGGGDIVARPRLRLGVLFAAPQVLASEPLGERAPTPTGREMLRPVGVEDLFSGEGCEESTDKL